MQEEKIIKVFNGYLILILTLIIFIGGFIGVVNEILWAIGLFVLGVFFIRGFFAGLLFFFGPFFVRVAAVVGLVKTRALKDHCCPSPEQSAQFQFATLGAFPLDGGRN